MLTDKEAMFWDDKEVSSTEVSESIKVGAPGTGGVGSRMSGRLGGFLRCTESFVGLTSIAFEFVESDDDSTWTPVKGNGTRTFSGAEMKAGEVDGDFSIRNISKAYIALRATVTGTVTAGRIEAGLTTGNVVH